MSDPHQAPAAIVCVQCQKAGLDPEAVFLSGDGWLCEPCYKAWNAQEELKQPKPFLYNPKAPIDLDKLPTYAGEDLVRSRRNAAVRGLLGSLIILVTGVLGTQALMTALAKGLRPSRGLGVLGGMPLLAIIGAILLFWNAFDLWKAIRGDTGFSAPEDAPPPSRITSGVRTAMQWLFSLPIIASLMVLLFSLALLGFGGVDVWHEYTLSRAPRPVPIDELEGAPIDPYCVLLLGEHVPWLDALTYTSFWYERSGITGAEQLREVYYPVLSRTRLDAARDQRTSGRAAGTLLRQDLLKGTEVLVLVRTTRFHKLEELDEAVRDPELGNKGLVGRVVESGAALPDGIVKSLQKSLPNLRREHVLIFEQGYGDYHASSDARAYALAGLLGVFVALLLPRFLRPRHPVVDEEPSKT